MDVDAVRMVVHESLENFELDNAVFHAEALYAEVTPLSAAPRTQRFEEFFPVTACARCYSRAQGERAL
jgi:hypothetical protein